MYCQVLNKVKWCNIESYPQKQKYKHSLPASQMQNNKRVLIKAGLSSGSIPAKQMGGYSGGCTHIGGPVRGLERGLYWKLLAPQSFSVVSGYHTWGVTCKEYCPFLPFALDREVVGSNPTWPNSTSWAMTTKKICKLVSCHSILWSCYGDVNINICKWFWLLEVAINQICTFL